MTLMIDSNTQKSKISGSRRKPELELLRCLAMMMVIALHFLGKGGLLGELSDPDMQPVRAVAWVLEALAVGAVNLYMLLSGYFLSRSHFKLSRLLRLLLQVWTYSAGIGLAAAALGFVPREEINTYFLLRLLFPILEEHYWFLTAYVFLYIMLPLIGNAVSAMDRRTFQLVLALFLTVFCLTKTVLPFQFDTDAFGYDCLWYLCVFLTAAYIRRFGFPLLEKKGRGFLLYLGASILILVWSFGLRAVYLNTDRFERILENGFHYNHLFPYLAAVGLFCAFLRVKLPEGFFARLTVWAGPHTLGVYLLHENLAVRYLWPQWFGADQIRTVTGLFLHLLLAILTVFTAGILVEWIRGLAMKGLHGVLLHFRGYQAAVERIEEADRLFGGRTQEGD